MDQRPITRLATLRQDLFAFEINGRIHKPDIEWMARKLEDAFRVLGQVDILIIMRGNMPWPAHPAGPRR